MDYMNKEWNGTLYISPEYIAADDHTGIYRARTGMNYSFVFFFERKFFQDEYIQRNVVWVKDYWRISIWYALLYIVIIFAGQEFMKNREKKELRKALIAWNLVLALFSTAGSLRLWPEFINTVRTHGVEHSYCSRDYAHGVTGFWTGMFVGSKFPELLDTFFIVIRKQKLIFLHWFHHATVLVYCWYSTLDFSPSGRWFALINYSVHAVMYGYYACRAMRFNIPRWVNIMITSGQISQMLVGIYVNLSVYHVKMSGRDCGVSFKNIWWSFFMYFSYFVLFSMFFLKTYISQPKKESSNTKAKVQ